MGKKTNRKVRSIIPFVPLCPRPVYGDKITGPFEDCNPCRETHPTNPNRRMLHIP